MSDHNFIWRSAPGRTAPELLEAIFVQRESLLQDLLERVTESATTGSKHHVLLIGPSGIGKTHLITLLNYRLSKESSLVDHIRAVWLPEDETITSFAQLLKRIYEILAELHPGEFPLAWLNELLDESPKRIQRQLQDTLIQSFVEKTLLLSIENLDHFFSGLGADGQHEWRAFLQEHPFTTIMASTQRLFADVKMRDKPFFGFFSPVHLEPLNLNDAVELLRYVARNRTDDDLVTYLDSAEGRARVQALNHLVGGNHRIFITLSGFITRESLDDLEGPFQKIADDMTLYYQERLRWLSPQQRQIVEYLCSQDGPRMPKQIARHLLAAENTVSSQLKKLLETGYLIRSQRGRDSLYEPAEPLMRLACDSQQPRHPLQMLINFLRAWYQPDALLLSMDDSVAESIQDSNYGVVLLTRIRSALQKAETLPCEVICSAIDSLRQSFGTGSTSTVREFVRLYAEFNALTQLGTSLVRSLAKIDMTNTTPASLQKWRDYWIESGSPHPEMQIPLRLFGAGIDYLIQQNRKLLLDLVFTERQILEQVLGIEASPGG